MAGAVPGQHSLADIPNGRALRRCHEYGASGPEQRFLENRRFHIHDCAGLIHHDQITRTGRADGSLSSIAAAIHHHMDVSNHTGNARSVPCGIGCSARFGFALGIDVRHQR